MKTTLIILPLLILVISGGFEVSAIGVVNCLLNVLKYASPAMKVIGQIDKFIDDRKIFDELEKISSQIKDVELSIIEVKQAINNLQTFISRTNKIEQLEDLILRINIFYGMYETYAANQNELEPSTLESFAYNVIEDSSISVKGYLLRLHNIAYARNFIIMLIDEIQKRSDDSCNSINRSKQQELYQIYNVFVLTEMKGFALMEFSYQILRAHEKGNFTTEYEIFRRDFQQRTENSLTILKQAMKNLDQTVWRCEPKNNEQEGRTYLELKKFLQGVLEYELNLNNGDTCYHSCEHYKATQSHSVDYNRHKCDGKYYDCQSIKYLSTYRPYICPAPSSSSRRYDFMDITYPCGFGDVAIECNYHVGTKGIACKENIEHMYGSTRFFQTCDKCLCICDDEGRESERYFSLKAAVSDIDNNMIVTGVRFVRKNYIIHLQIQEGKLLNNGLVDKNSVRWVSDQFTYLMNEQEYHTLSWHERDIDLDILTAPSDHVVTGVRFRMLGNRLNMQIQVSEVDFDTGIIAEGSTFWGGNDNYENRKVTFNQPDVPTRSSNQAKPIASENAYTSFTYTDKKKDLSQTAIPFLDAQDVIHDPPVPLEGIGLFLKGVEGFGGYIAPTIITYDYSV